jgi:hypothetical protein
MAKDNRTYTKGNIIVEEIKVGDIHYEFEYALGVKSEVITLPEMVDGMWEWKSKNVYNGEIIEYGVNPKYTHYGPNLYDHESYNVTMYLGEPSE